MRLKSFYGPTLTEAMRLVRETLGDSAIIVSTRDDETGGIRVTAALEESPAFSEDGSLTSLDSVRDGSEVIEIIAGTLLGHHVPPSLAERLLASATQHANDDPVLSLGAAFDAHFQFRPITDDNAGKPLIFIGPPGGGKTLCAAKFATQATIARRPVTVISTDTERAGGMEQLAAFTRLLKVNLIEIEDSHALRDAIAIQPTGTAILIDTPGRNPFSDAERKQIAPLVAAVGGNAVLVLPANLDSSEAIDIVQEYRALGATRLLATRLDITRRLGGLLRTIFESRMPLANFSDTPKVTEPPLPLNPITLANLVLPASALPQEKATGTHD